MDLGQKIEILRKKQNITQSGLAEKLDVSRQTVYKWEAGIVSPDIKKLKDLAELLDISVDHLVDDKFDLNQTEEVKDENKTSVQMTQRRSMVDYLILAPVTLGVFILIFMFYCFGAMVIGFSAGVVIGSVLAPFYGILLLFMNASQGFPAILLSISVIFAGLALIYPSYLFFGFYKKFYLETAKKLYKRIKNFNWKKVFGHE